MRSDYAHAVFSVPVYVEGAPFSARLNAWGRTGVAWWGLLTWPQRVVWQPPIDASTVQLAAWVPAARLREWRQVSSDGVARLSLPLNHADWPPPPGWAGHFGGAWEDGPMPVPPGAEVDRLAVWQRRRAGPQR